jgi:four helix bundle protein
MIRDITKIKAWQYADHLTIKVYSVTKKFPKEELYGLVSQLRRAAVSVPTNIVEGASREHKKEYLQFLYISRGSLEEIRYLIHLAERLNYFSNGNYTELNELVENTSKTLHGLVVAVQKEVG